MSTTNKTLIVMGITTVIFMLACFFFIWHDKVIPDSLIYSFFAAVGTEGCVLGWIKTGNIKNESVRLQKGDNENENNN